MTVAAIVLAASPASALADADGLARVRRIADAAWAGGALPVVIVSFDPDGAVAQALAGASVTLAEPAPPETGPVGQIARGLEVAGELVRETDAALIWPARMCWVGPESVTSLLEAHGTSPGSLLRPTYAAEPGWPALLPLTARPILATIGPARMPGELLEDLLAAGLPTRLLDLGDPGTTIDGETARLDLPPYEGPPQPAADHVHEWGARVADEPDSAPIPPPTVPYPGTG